MSTLTGQPLDSPSSTDISSLLQRATSAIPDTFYIYDLVAQRLVYANHQVHTLFGYTREQIQEVDLESTSQMIHPADVSTLPQHLKRLESAKDDEIIEYEYRLRYANGEWHWLHTHEVILTRTADGRPQQIAGSMQDITALKRAENHTAILQKITSRFSGASTVTQVAETILDEATSSLEGHGGVVALLTQDKQALQLVSAANLPREVAEQFQHLPLHLPTPLTDAARTGQPVWIASREEYLTRYPHLQNTLISTGTQANATLPLPINQHVIGSVSLSYPIPQPFPAPDREFLSALAGQCAQAMERARLYEAEVQARQAAEKADQLKMLFLGMISHELRTPLSSIKGFVTTLLATDVTFSPQEQYDFLYTINQEVDRLTELIDQLLDLSRLQAGTLHIQPELQPVRTILIAATPQLNTVTAQHELVIRLDEDLPHVIADTRRIAQVLINLVGNAAKFSPPQTPITVTVTARDGEVQVDVSDQGVGIPAEARQTVFEAFRQLKHPGYTSPKGAGLGLAICKGIIEAHGQHIWVSANQPQGTTISFTLPTQPNHT